MESALEKTKTSGGRMVFIFTLLYMVGYLTRNNYSTVIAEMVTATGLSKTQLSAALTGGFITYGAGQLVSGFLGDRVSPKKLLTLGLSVTSLMNVLLPLCPNVGMMTVVWCFNAAAQAFLWPPMVRVLASQLSAEAYANATVTISLGAYAGNLLLYLLAPLVISLLNWKAVFFISGACGFVMLAVWSGFRMPDSALPVKGAARKSVDLRCLLTPVMAGILIAIVCIGTLRDGVTTWMPSYIAETYHLGNRVAILTGVLLPVFSMIAVYAAGQIYRRFFKSPVTCAAAIFGVGAGAALGLALLSGSSAALSVFLSALLTGCMHGVNLMFISLLPTFFRRFGCVSTASGVLNAAVYVGSAVSTYGVAALSDLWGWGATLWIWLGIATVGTALCLISIRPWAKSYGEAEK